MNSRARAIVEALALLSTPAILVGCALFDNQQTALLSYAAVLTSIGVLFALYESSRPRLRDIMPTVVLAALAAAGRILFAPIPDFKPVSAIAIIAGVVFGRRGGFMVGSLAALASNFFFGQGAWTPWQMYAWGLVGYGAGLLAQVGVRDGRCFIDAHPSIVYVYGFVACLGYGFILNAWSILAFFHAQQSGLAGILAVYATALPFDIVHGAATVVFLAALYAPWKKKLRRIKVKFGLVS